MRLVACSLLLGATLLGLAGCHDDPTSPGSNDSVAAVPSVSGTVTAMVGGSGRTVTFTFNPSDGKSVQYLQVVNLSNLPQGWSAPSSGFGCATISTGNGCLLTLTFAPSSDTSGTLTLGFTYTNNAGNPEEGVVTIPYAATEHDNVVGTASPSGQVSVVVGASAPVTVTFGTDDGNSASGFALTSSLSSLPSGWSSGASSFSCNTVSTGGACQLALGYAPTSAGSGTLTLGYRFTDNSGAAQTGTVAIAYVATTNDNAVATVSPTGTIGVGLGASQPVTVTFTTDDGNTASALSISSSALSALPTGWSSSNSFSCATFSTGSGCQLPLRFAPTAASSGTLQLGYTYLDNAAIAKSGTVSITYATAMHAYVADQQLGIVMCSLGASGSLTGCASTGSGFRNPSSIVFSGSYAYVTDLGNSAVDVCPVDQDGTLGTCVSAYSILQTGNLEVNGSYLYVPWGDPSTSVNGPTVCSIGSDGSLSGCTETGADPSETSDVAFSGQYVYVSTYGQHGPGLLLCSAGSGGSIVGCNGVSTGQSQAFSTTIYQGNLYMVSNSGVTTCAIGSDGTLSNCATSMPFSYASGWSTQPSYNLVISNGYAYLSYNADNFPRGFAQGVAVCSVNADGSLSSCADSGASFGSPYGITFH